MEPPFKSLRFPYLGSAGFDEDLAFYRQVLGADRVWQFDAFESQVAAVRLGDGPLVLLADHRPAPSCILVYEVEDLDRTAADLRARGWQPSGERFEIPNGPCFVFNDPSGNPLAIFEDQRPQAMERAFADSENGPAVHGEGDPPTEE